MRILVTGAFGFLGGRIAQALSKSGHVVVIGSSKRLEQAEWLPEAKIAFLNWDDTPTLEESCADIDLVIHSAGMNAQDCVSNPVRALEFNGVYTAKLVHAAEVAKVKSFIYLSTVHVYTETLEGLVTDNTCPENNHPYAASHLAGEKAVVYADMNNEIKGVVLRLSNCFGKPAHEKVNCWNLLVNDLCRQAVEKRKMVLRSSGQQLCDFITINKLCRDIQSIVGFFDTNTFLAHPVLNISSANSISVNEMANLIQVRCATVLGYKPDINLNQNDVSSYSKNLQIAPSKYIQDLGNPTEIQSELDELLDFCARNYG